MNPGFDRFPSAPTRGPRWRPTFPRRLELGGRVAFRKRRPVALNASRTRILDSLRGNLTLQLDPALADARRGFFLTYIVSFNEWHEGTAFEPAANLADLTPAQRAIGYHNPDEGRWRLDLLRDLLPQLAP